MASSRKFFNAKPSYIYPAPVGADHENNLFEFDESDMYTSADSAGLVPAKNPVPSSRGSSRKLAKWNEALGDHRRKNMMHVTSSSLPVNVPDWSKILKNEYREHSRRDNYEGVGDEDDRGATRESCYGLVPPHEYLAMRRGASFSVHEGAGRTLKGRDLRRVRNAIWKKVGFED